MDGTLLGTDDHFRTDGSRCKGPDANDNSGLTDFGIGGQLEIDNGHPELDGVIYQWNDPFGVCSPWANGTVNQDGVPSLDRNGPAFLNQFGTMGVNKLLVSIELSGFAGYTDPAGVNASDPPSDGTPVTAKQMESLAWLIAWVHDGARVPWSTFPAHPNYDNVVTALEHWELSLKACPYEPVRRMRDQYLGRARAIMKHFQTGGVAPVPPDVITLPGTGTNGGVTTGTPATFAINDRIKVSAPAAPINFRSGPSTSASIIGTLPNGQTLCVLDAPIAADAHKWYHVRKSNTNITGYVAGELCELYAKDGCGTNNPAPKFAVGDLVRVIDGPVNVRTSPGTSGSDVTVAGMQATDPFVAPSRGLPEDVIAFARNCQAERLDDAIAYINEVYRLGPITGLDAAIIVAQSAEETGSGGGDGWVSTIWRDRLNPAGIGVTDTQDYGYSFATGVAAARAHVAHLFAYVFGDTKALPADLVGADPRYQAVFDAGYAGTAQVIDDLSTTWASDPNYGPSIAARGDAIFGSSIQSVTSSGPGSSLGLLENGTEFCILEGPVFANNYEWYRTSVNTMEGWVASEFCAIKRAGGCSGAAGGTGKFAVNDRVRVFDGPLHVRASASTSAEIVGEFDQDAEFCITDGPVFADNYEWYGTTDGWVAGDFCAIVAKAGCAAPPPAPARFAFEDRIYVADGDPPLNVRSGPTTTARVIGQLSEGTAACVFDGPDFADGYEWYYVGGGGLLGWVAGDFCGLLASGGCRSTVSDGKFGPGDRIQVTDGPVHLRSGPSLGDAPIDSLATWTIMDVIGGPVYADGYDWFEVDAGGEQGWVAGIFCGLYAANAAVFSAADLTTPVAVVSPSGVSLGDILVTPDDGVNLRSGASLSASVIVAMPKGTIAVVVGARLSADGHVWQQVDTGFGRGWVASDMVERMKNPGNLLANPTADVDLTSIIAVDSGSTLSRVLVDGNYRVKCVNSGTTGNQGLRYQSNITSPYVHTHKFSAIVDVFGAGVIDWAKLRLGYSEWLDLDVQSG